MIKAVKNTFGGMKQDINKSDFPNTFYYSAEHIRITTTDTQSTGKVINEKGNLLKVTLPSPFIDTVNTKIIYGSNTLDYLSDGNVELDKFINKQSGVQRLIGGVKTRDSIILFSTDDNGFDCIWEIQNLLINQFDLKLLYTRNLGFSTSFPIQALYNYENKKIQKVYWVDGNSQLRFINKTASTLNGDLQNLIDINSNVLDIVSNFKLSQIYINGYNSGGIHTSGMIQYAYTLYRLNGAQTKISPLSELISLDKGDNFGGGSLNEIVGKIPTIQLNNIDKDYTHIKIYAIKYTTLNTVPAISIIADREINNYNLFIYEDDGSIISTIALNTFEFLGSNPIIPKHIEAKDNILFASNIKELQFDVEFDARAYSFNSSSNIQIIINDNTLPINLPGSYLDKELPVYSLNTDMINPNLSVYKYQENGTVLGGTGKFISYDITPVNIPTNSTKFFKSGEIYRIGIEFYNGLGQTSLPKWIADFKVPMCNLNGTESNLAININIEGITYLKNLGVTGYRMLRVQRNEADKTIICQGLLNGMMFFDTNDASNSPRFESYAVRKASSEVNLKLPNHLLRHFDNNLLPLKKNTHLDFMKGPARDPNAEIGADPQGERSSSFQYNRMFQLYSPDILFNSPTFSSGLTFKIIGFQKESKTSFWGQERDINSKNIIHEAKSSNTLTLTSAGSIVTTILGDSAKLQNNGMIAPSGAANGGIAFGMDFYQYYREYKGGFVPVGIDNSYNIYGVPEVTEQGAGRKLYNNDGKLAYSNSFQSIITDDITTEAAGTPAITSTNSYGNKCLTLVQGDNNINLDLDSRKSLSQLKEDNGIVDTDGVLLCDIMRTLSNQYGGATHEDKTRNIYLKIGNYIDISKLNTSSSEVILNHGDTFVGDFKFLRVAKTNTEVYDPASFQWTETVNIRVETSVDLSNRNDISFSTWDNRFQPKFTEYENYNRVYSQENTTVITQDLSFKFKKIKEFDTRIAASKIKLPGEFIDNWTDLLDNEQLDLDGKYGPVNSLINFKDELYALQDEAIAKIIINPRVQVQGNNSLAIELGRGSVLYDYKYLTTKSGTTNKWSVITTPSGFYYYDTLNNGLGRAPDHLIKNLSDSKFLHNVFVNNVDYSIIKKDNPILGQGISTGYDLLNKDVYMSFLQGVNSFTVCFNELKDEFVDMKKYYPSMYVDKGFKFLSTSTDNNKLYLHNAGDYNNFYGSMIPSSITLLVNSQEHINAVFNNILFKSEAYLNNVDLANETLSTIQVYNEYQDTGVVNLVPGALGNIRRKFRDWKLQIPRAKNSRDRIRNPWVFIKLTFNNPNNYKLILHDIITYYSI